MEKGLSIYWTTLRKRDDAVNWKRMHYMALWVTGTGRSCGPVPRQTIEWMNIPLEAIFVTLNEPSTKEQYRILHSVFRRHSGVSVFKIGGTLFRTGREFKERNSRMSIFSCIRCGGWIGRLDCRQSPVGRGL